MTPLSMEEFSAIERPWREVLFFYTPFCGTCKLGERMLEMCEAAWPEVSSVLHACRVAEWQPLVQSWEIESVPALIFLEKGEVQKKLYAFHSVSDLYETLIPFLNLKNH